MNKHIIILFFIAKSVALQGQTNNSDTILLKLAAREVQKGGPIAYTDKSLFVSSNDEWLSEAMEKQFLSGIVSIGKTDTLLLDKNESEYLKQQTHPTIIWPDSLFESGIRVDSSHYLQYIVAARNQYNEKLKRYMADSIDTKKLIGERPFVFAFSKPIYLRNNSICIISFTAFCGVGCGLSQSAIYKLDGNKWTKWMVLATSVF